VGRSACNSRRRGGRTASVRGSPTTAVTSGPRRVRPAHRPAR
jgi:hypothetical protein